MRAHARVCELCDIVIAQRSGIMPNVDHHVLWVWLECLGSADVRRERFWRVVIARNAVFFRSFVASKARKGRSEKRGGAEDRLPKMSTKFAPRLRVRTIWKSKSLKLEGFGGLFEVELRKICTRPARESDVEVKTVKTQGARDVFGGSKCVSRGRRRDFDTLQNTRQAQEFVRVAKTLAGVGDLKRV